MEKVTELCPHCGYEVETDAVLGLFRCPICGKVTVTCSMCLANSDNLDYCNTCPLEYASKKINKEEEKKPIKDFDNSNF